MLKPRPELRATRYGQEGTNDYGVKGARPFVMRKLQGRLMTTKLTNRFEEAGGEHDA
jgi:hypothetical protein